VKETDLLLLLEIVAFGSRCARWATEGIRDGGRGTGYTWESMALGWLGPEAPAIKRLLVGVVVGLVILVAVVAFVPWQADILAFWDGVAATFLVVVWYHVGRLDGPATAATAVREDDSRTMTRLILVTAATVSLVGVAMTLEKATKEGGAPQFVLAVAALVTIALSWGVVHTAYTLRYAHLYYTPPSGGVDFQQHDDPDYRDFAYLAFTVGMTFQVSDDEIQNRAIRHAVVAHALLSYVFGVVIIAAAINVVAGFVH